MSLVAYDQVCPLCEGRGVRTETIVESVHTRRCTSCDGTGKVPRPYGWRPHEPVNTSIVRCDECVRGRDHSGRRCRGCNGSGYVERKHES